MRQIFLLFFLVVLSVSLLQGQEVNKSVSIRILSDYDKLQPGYSHRIAIELQIHEPYHINAHEPTEPYLIPTTVKLEEREGFTIGKVNYPSPLIKKFAFSETPLAVYEDTIYIYTTITLEPEFNQSQVILKGSVDYQACDNQSCYAPEELIFSQKFPVAKAGEIVVPIHQDIFSSQQNVEEDIGAQPAKEGLVRDIEQKGLLVTFILVFLAGLGLNLTPCVYPLIPITISYFGGQAQGKKGSLVTHAILYVLGMAITYSILGMIAAFTGSLFGSALQNPYIMVSIALVLVVLALSMFDLYEIRIPAFLSNFAGGARQGYFGTIFMGLTVGIVAAPCIGPFVLALLTYVGEKGNLLLGFSLFFVLALGLGVPFILLGIFSGSMNKLPRSGAWMVWVRSIFGFVLIAMAIYFIAPLFPNILYYHFTLAMVMLLGGIYMAWIEPTQTTGKFFTVIRNLVGMVFFILALILATNGVQSYLNDALKKASVISAVEVPRDEILWFDYSEEMIASAAQQGKPVMLDFYADWCIPCKELDKFTFSEEEVVKKSRNFIMLKVDMTRTGNPEVQELKKKYQIKGVPTLVFLSPQGEEIPETRIVGFVDKNQFLPIMERALKYSSEEKK